MSFIGTLILGIVNLLIYSLIAILMASIVAVPFWWVFEDEKVYRGVVLVIAVFLFMWFLFTLGLRFFV